MRRKVGSLRGLYTSYDLQFQDLIGTLLPLLAKPIDCARGTQRKKSNGQTCHHMREFCRWWVTIAMYNKVANAPHNLLSQRVILLSQQERCKGLAAC